MVKISLFLLSVISTWIMSSCQSSTNGQHQYKQTSRLSSNFGYDLANAKTYKLSSALDEISGIAFHPQKSEFIYAIQDEQGKLFTYDLKQEKIIDEFFFGKNGDYEGIATDGKFFYVLKSNGDIHYFPFDHSKDKSKVQVAKDLLPKGEYESLAFNPIDNTLQVLCKECKVDKSNNTLTGYKFTIQDNGSITLNYSTFSLALAEIQKFDSSISKLIKPSAMTFNSFTKEWYIISSVDKTLIVTDVSLKPKNVLSFTRSQFQQPEGLAFNGQGDLFISSEIGNSSSAALYQFKSK